MHSICKTNIATGYSWNTTCDSGQVIKDWANPIKNDINLEHFISEIQPHFLEGLTVMQASPKWPLKVRTRGEALYLCL